MFTPIKKTFQYGRDTVTLETGEIARQASGSVLVSMGDTVVLVTVVGNKEAKVGQDFFPLTVDYLERTYAAGRIPGGYFKRETKPSEHEVLVSRLIDRPLRPLFPEGFYNEVQIVAQVLSIDPEIAADIPALIGASAALAISGIPFDGPIGGARVGYVGGEYILNPRAADLANSELDLVLAGTEDAILMVESEAKELSEEILLGALVFGHDALKKAITAINEFADEVNPEMWEWKAAPKDKDLIERVEALAKAHLQEAYAVREKVSRSANIQTIRDDVLSQVITEADEEADDADRINLVKSIFKDTEAKIVRGKILSGEPRIDGRDTRTVRPISIRTGVLPRTHGSVLFTRGETQALVVTTLGTKTDEQSIDALTGGYSERFMLHYNFPPYSTGETGRMGAPKRREVGHGRLAKRALMAVLPKVEDFSYTMRVVSEITESNGSSSMASVCGGCLSLMDAGVPLKSHVAGIAMGLIKEGNRFAVLTDILGDEDHLGDMDFKVAGTEQGVTALQMDIKIQGITKEIMRVALDQAKEGRMHILGLMKNALESSRQDVSEHAPRLYTMKINPEKIRDVIGKGGAVIRALTEETGTSIDIQEDGTIIIAAISSAGADEAKKRIEALTAEVEIGRIYEGPVVKILDKNVGAIISIMPGRDGLLHVSQIANERVNNVADYLQEGQVVRVKVLEQDEKGRIRLSMKALLTDNLPSEEITS